MLPAYAELHCLSNFSFLRGASHPEELVERAHALGYAALALTDECSLAGAVRAHLAAKELGVKLVVGSEFTLVDGLKLALYATDRESFGDLAQLITRGRRNAKKGAYALTRDDVAAHRERCLAVWFPNESKAADARWIADIFGKRAWIAAELLARAGDRPRLERLTALSRECGLPLVAASDVHMHVRARRALQDTLTAIRLKTPIAECGYALFPNGERHLRSRAKLATIYPPALLEETLALAERCTFSLDELRYEYPEEIVPPGETPSSYLRKLTDDGLRRRYGDRVPDDVRELCDHELALVAELRYEPYFLTVYDIVAFARSQKILCQGRGSAANSAVCYALGITEVDPARISTLFERFISRERNEPPDIDVDFEHQRREEVMQYVYKKYGRDRAALAATLITYRPKSAVRDVGKALGLDLAQVDRLSGIFAWWDGRTVDPHRIRAAGFDPDNPLIARLIALTGELMGFPRHLSQHVGGFVIAHGLLERMVPVENAAMPDRTVIQWDKDDLDALGLLKVDCLALGMLSAIRRALAMISARDGRELRMQDIPAEDPNVYAMIQRADTIGVFQIESRAQQSMLPRLKPKTFYDLVIEVAIVRPGPIQGGMVHPYLKRRQGLERVTYPSDAVKAVLERTLGVPIFQEQVMQLAIVAAGFTPGEADRLRRSMAAWRRKGGLEKFEQRLVDGMAARGYAEEFARQIYQQILGFGEYGFPECVVGETRVVDADTGRWLTIDEIISGNASFQNTLACDDELRLQKRKVIKVSASGTKPVWRLHTALGHRITATAEHPFMTLQGWRTLGELRTGDHVAVARSLRIKGSRRWPAYKILVLADLVAEGNVCHPNTFYFYTTASWHCEEFVKAVERFPNTRAVVERHRSCFSVRVRPVDQRRPIGAVVWIRRLGIWGSTARHKFLPPEVFELSDRDIALLLARLWEGDGGLSLKGHATYDTASARLATEVQHLLLRLGIVARLYRRVRAYKGRALEHNVVTVTGEEPLTLFWQHIGRRFLDPEKRQRSEKLAACRNGRMSRDIIPAEVRKIIRAERDIAKLSWEEIGRKTGLSVREIQSRRSDTKIGFRRFVIDRLAKVLRSPQLQRLADSDVYWDRIVKIETMGYQPTYDLQIEGHHNFLANNLIVHNSHSASFALLVYISCWLKHYEPAAFCAALLNSQPMGFYAPAQLVADARRHGVDVRPVDVTISEWDCALEGKAGPSAEPALSTVEGARDDKVIGRNDKVIGRNDSKSCRDDSKSCRDDSEICRDDSEICRDDSESCHSEGIASSPEEPASRTLRLGLRMIKGLTEAGAQRIVDARRAHPFASVADLALRAKLDRRDLTALADADALVALAGHRHGAVWEVAGVERLPEILAGATFDEASPALSAPTEGQDIVADYRRLGLTLRRHPLALLRRQLRAKRMMTSEDILRTPHGKLARVAGIVIGRQRPDTKSGVVFVTLEDETGATNVIVWRDVGDKQRRELLGARLMAVYGKVEREGDVVHVVAGKLVDMTPMLGSLPTRSRDFH